VNKILNSAKEKISHPSYNADLEKLVEVKNEKSTNALQKVYEMIGKKD